MAPVSSDQPYIPDRKVSNVKLRNLRSPILMTAVLILTVMPTLAVPVTNHFKTEGWTVDYELPFDETEPGSVLTLNVTIEAKVHNYDFELLVRVDEPLKLSENRVSYPELSVGDFRRECFTISVPSEVQSDEVYVINLRASSHSNPAGIGGLRSPLDFLEYVFDTVEKPEHALKLTIVLRPQLKITDLWTVSDLPFTFIEGRDFTVSTTARNEGTGPAKNVQAQILLPEGLSLSHGDETILLGDIAPGNEKIATWRVKAHWGEIFKLETVISAENSEPISATKEVGVTPFVVITIAAIIILAILAAIGYFVLKRLDII